MDVYHAVEALVDPKVPEYLMSKVNQADARAAYDALIDFTKVVKANPITPSTHASTVSSSAASSISEAASKLGGSKRTFVVVPFRSKHAHNTQRNDDAPHHQDRGARARRNAFGVVVPGGFLRPGSWRGG